MFCRKAAHCKEHEKIKYNFKDEWPLLEFFQSDLEHLLQVMKRSHNHIKDKALKAEMNKLIEDLEHKINLHKEWGQWE